MFSSPKNFKKFILDLMMTVAVLIVFVGGVEAVAEYRAQARGELKELHEHIQKMQENYQAAGREVKNHYTLDNIRPGLMGIVLQEETCATSARPSVPCAIQTTHPKKKVYVVGPFKNNGWLSEKISEQCATPTSSCVAWEKIEPYTNKYPYNQHYDPKRYGSAHRAFAIYTL